MISETRLKETHARLSSYNRRPAEIVYSGADQREDDRALIGGMSCKRCGSPMHDPKKTAEYVRNLPMGKFLLHSFYECTNYICKWGRR